MTFREKLKTAMDDLGITQAKVAALTGKSKASVSQYMSGQQVPSAKVQSEIAVALGLSNDYFTRPDDVGEILPTLQCRDGIISRMTPKDAARLMGLSIQTIYAGLRQGVFPWGYGIHTSEDRWVYYINARRFREIEGI